MRAFSPAALAHLARRTGYQTRTLLWVAARNRSTAAVETMGLWSGEYTRVFTIAGDEREYFGVGAMLGLDPIVAQTGGSIRMQRLSLSSLPVEVQQLFTAYEPRLAPVEVHRALFDPDSQALIEPPHRVFKGWIDRAPRTRPEADGRATIEVAVASASRALTRVMTARQSDATQRLRGGDLFRRYADVSGSVEVSWGEARVTPPSTTNTTTAGSGTGGSSFWGKSGER